jgi:hypothetical protein
MIIKNLRLQNMHEKPGHFLGAQLESRMELEYYQPEAAGQA